MATGTRELLEVVEERCINRSIMVASQLPIENWHAVLGDPTAADTIPDHPVHTVHRCASVASPCAGSPNQRQTISDQ